MSTQKRNPLLHPVIYIIFLPLQPFPPTPLPAQQSAQVLSSSLLSGKLILIFFFFLFRNSSHWAPASSYWQSVSEAARNITVSLPYNFWRGKRLHFHREPIRPRASYSLKHLLLSRFHCDECFIFEKRSDKSIRKDYIYVNKRKPKKKNANPLPHSRRVQTND